MIVLRVTVGDRSVEVRSPARALLLGSDPDADVRVSDAGWSGREARLVHAGTRVILKRPGIPRDLKLRVGDAITLGAARIAVLGLMPLRQAAGSAAPVFGGYDEDLAQRAASPAAGAGPATLARADVPRQVQTTAASSPNEQRPGPRGTSPVPKAPVTGFRPPDFGEELVRQIKRAPFFVISVGVHALIFLALSIFLDAVEAGARKADGGSLRSSVQDSAAEVSPRESESFEPLDDLLEPLVPEIKDPLPPSELEVLDDASRESEVPRLAELDLPDERPLVVGLNPSIASARARTRAPTAKVREADLVETFLKGEAADANARSADYLRSQLIGLGTGTQGDPFRDLKKRDFLVVDGSFDKIGRVLDALRLPYTLVPPTSVAQPSAPDLAQHKLVFWNCGEALPSSMTQVIARRLRKFVEEGGYLFTTDWAVANVLMHAFPGYLGTSGARSPLPEMVVKIQPGASAARHPLLKGVFSPRVEGHWWLEQASFDLQVRKEHEKDVEVLIESPDLQQLLGRSPALAVTFPYGKGRVLHIMGHYFQEAGNLQGTISAHRLALNFVLMRLGREHDE